MIYYYIMLQSNTYRLLREFMDHPTTHFQVRELSRRLRLGQPSVANHLQALLGMDLVRKERHGVYPAFIAQRDSRLFRTLRKADMLVRLEESGLLDALWDTVQPDAIILFGSVSRGEDIESSDIDLFLLADEMRVDLQRWERALARKISLFFCEDFDYLSEELKNNLLNGFPLRGYLDVYAEHRSGQEKSAQHSAHRGSPGKKNRAPRRGRYGRPHRGRLLRDREGTLYGAPAARRQKDAEP